jgi:hypothetical protein
MRMKRAFARRTLADGSMVGTEERLYGTVLGSPQMVGEQMFALALLSSWGEETKIHGIGDGAPWIPQ